MVVKLHSDLVTATTNSIPSLILDRLPAIEMPAIVSMSFQNLFPHVLPLEYSVKMPTKIPNTIHSIDLDHIVHLSSPISDSASQFILRILILGGIYHSIVSSQ